MRGFIFHDRRRLKRAAGVLSHRHGRNLALNSIGETTMTFLTRYHPTFNNVHIHNLERVLDSFLADTAPRSTGATRFAVDVHEDGDAYLVTADLPGVKKEDIQVDIDGAVVSITAEWKATTGNDDTAAKPLRGERRTRAGEGKLSRSFQLPVELDSEAANAKFENGVLELRLPKQLQATAKRVMVQ
jgi:HSP20 family protein